LRTHLFTDSQTRRIISSAVNPVAAGQTGRSSRLLAADNLEVTMAV